METEEERKARERRDASRAVVNGIGDAVRALGNLHYVGNYAPNGGYDTKDNLSTQYQARLDRARAEREKNRDWAMNYALGKAKEERDQRDFNWKMETDKRDYNRQKEQDEQKQKNFETEMQHKKYALAQQKELAGNKLDFQKEEANRKDAATNRRLDIQELNAETQRMKAQNSGRGGSGSRGGRGSREVWQTGEKSYVEIDRSRLNDEQIGHLFDMIPENMQYYYENGKRKPIRGRDHMKAAIGMYLRDPNVSDEDKAGLRDAINAIGTQRDGGNSGGGGSNSGKKSPTGGSNKKKSPTA